MVILYSLTLLVGVLAAIGQSYSEPIDLTKTNDYAISSSSTEGTKLNYPQNGKAQQSIEGLTTLPAEHLSEVDFLLTGLRFTFIASPVTCVTKDSDQTVEATFIECVKNCDQNDTCAGFVFEFSTIRRNPLTSQGVCILEEAMCHNKTARGHADLNQLQFTKMDVNQFLPLNAFNENICHKAEADNTSVKVRETLKANITTTIGWDDCNGDRSCCFDENRADSKTQRCFFIQRHGYFFCGEAVTQEFDDGSVWFNESKVVAAADYELPEAHRKTLKQCSSYTENPVFVFNNQNASSSSVAIASVICSTMFANCRAVCYSNDDSAYNSSNTNQNSSLPEAVWLIAREHEDKENSSSTRRRRHACRQHSDCNAAAYCDSRTKRCEWKHGECDCSGGSPKVCRGKWREGTCVPKPECTSHAQCKTGYHCANGKCTANHGDCKDPSTKCPGTWHAGKCEPLRDTCFTDSDCRRGSAPSPLCIHCKCHCHCKSGTCYGDLDRGSCRAKRGHCLSDGECRDKGHHCSPDKQTCVPKPGADCHCAGDHKCLGEFDRNGGCNPRRGYCYEQRHCLSQDVCITREFKCRHRSCGNGYGELDSSGKCVARHGYCLSDADCRHRADYYCTNTNVCQERYRREPPPVKPEPPPPDPPIEPKPDQPEPPQPDQPELPPVQPEPPLPPRPDPPTSPATTQPPCKGAYPDDDDIDQSLEELRHWRPNVPVPNIAKGERVLTEWLLNKWLQTMQCHHNKTSGHHWTKLNGLKAKMLLIREQLHITYNGSCGKLSDSHGFCGSMINATTVRGMVEWLAHLSGSKTSEFFQLVFASDDLSKYVRLHHLDKGYKSIRSARDKLTRSCDAANAELQVTHSNLPTLPGDNGVWCAEPKQSCFSLVDFAGCLELHVQLLRFVAAACGSLSNQSATANFAKAVQREAEHILMSYSNCTSTSLAKHHTLWPEN